MSKAWYSFVNVWLNPEMKQADIFVLALARWDAPYASTAWSLSQALSQYRRVFYVENPFTFKDRWLGRHQPQLQARLPVFQGQTSPVKKFHKNLLYATPPPVWPVNWLPAGHLYHQIARKNQGRVQKFIRLHTQKNQIRAGIYLNVFNPYYWQAGKSIFPQAKTVYYSVDRIHQAPYLGKHGPSWEKQALQEADLTLATSSNLLEEIRPYGSSPSHLLANAADVSLFSKALHESYPLPPEMDPTYRHRAVYCGALGFRMDWPLLEAVASRLSHWQFVMIGPYQEAQIGPYRRLPNLTFCGPKAQELLPAYLQHAQAGLIPYLNNAFTEAIYPLKLHEYQAAGLPTVSTPFSVDLNEQAGVFLAQNPDDFAQALQQTARHEFRPSLSEAAQKESWDQRAIQLLDLLHN